MVRLSFGTYGERRDGSDWSGPPSAADLTTIGNTTRHGFTDHEHLDAVGLIHMNGRVYEPVIGGFLSVDPLLALGSSQDVNSYSYVWCIFRLMPGHSSRASRAAIPVHAGPPFRQMPGWGV